MTKEITKAFILQQLQDKLGLRELVQERFTFDEQVRPIYDIGPHLRRREIVMEEKSVTSAAAFSFFTVPANERWFFNGYDIVFMAVGAYKVSGLLIRRTSTSYSQYLDLKEGQTGSYHVGLHATCLLDPGDVISVLVDDYTSTANLRVYCDFEKETIR